MLSLSITSFLLLFCVLNIGSCENYNDLKNLETEFALTLYQKLAERHNRTNLVISPASISFSLGLLQFGARGNTFGQLKHALGYSIHDKNIQNLLHTAYKERINSNQSIIVHLACTLFVQAGMQLSPEFVQQAAWWGNNTVQQSNFSDPNRTKAQIREWITQNTGETSSLSLDTIESPLNQIAVVSTINFRSTWQRQFSFTHTQALSFTTPDGITLKVPTMHLRAEVNYGEFLVGSLDKISVVEIPYLEEKVSMFVVLPSNRRTSLARIETYFSAQTLSLWSSTLRRTAMDIVLPRFKIQNHLDLKCILPALGITDMFDQTEANFKGISEQGGLYISEVFHKAKIEVTEDGTRASGITAMLLLKRSRAPVFKADRPFNFILSQARTGKHGFNSVHRKTYKSYTVNLKLIHLLVYFSKALRRYYTYLSSTFDLGSFFSFNDPVIHQGGIGVTEQSLSIFWPDALPDAYAEFTADNYSLGPERNICSYLGSNAQSPDFETEVQALDIVMAGNVVYLEKKVSYSYLTKGLLSNVYIIWIVTAGICR